MDHQFGVQKPGSGFIESRVLGDKISRVSDMSSTSPLRLLSPTSAREVRAVLVFLLSHGGGLVAGDQTKTQITVCPNSRLGLLTQGSRKIYKKTSGKACCVQMLNADVGADSAVLILPDPIQPFSQSRYRQEQQFHIDPSSSSLLILDWISEGRSARGEMGAYTVDRFE